MRLRFYSLLLTIAAMFCCQSVLAQKEANVWYFGDSAGVDFNQNPPAPLLDGMIDTYEGCATISSEQGRLLFYTDGITVYNGRHRVMQNGQGLLGDPSASQSGVVARLPGNPDIYYVFSVDNDAGPNGLHYSVIDMRLAGGQGAVTLKNVPLASPVTEKITAVLHQNELDIWIMVHDWGTNDFLAYKLTSQGLQPPVISSTGKVHSGGVSNARGCMKVSPDGSKLGVAIAFQNSLELFDFDNGTGIINNPLDLGMIPGSFGVEFSPDNSKLYVSTVDISPGELYQFDLSSGLPATILASKTFIGKTTSLSLGALQLGPDQRIYAARSGGVFLGVIEEPDSLGLACTYVDDGFHLGGRNAQLGLPTFIQSYFLPPRAGFNFTVPCVGDSTRFFGTASDTPDSWFWDFGDPGSGAANFSSIQNPKHLYPAPGVYQVTLIVEKDSLRDTVQNDVRVYGYPDIELGPADTIICDAPSLVLNAGGNANVYQWSTGETSRSITVTQDGSYWLTAANGPCQDIDSINIKFLKIPFVDIGGDQDLCEGEQYLLTAGNPGADFLWSTGDTTSAIEVGTSGTYWVRVSAGICFKEDTATLTFHALPTVNLGPDRELCTRSVTLNANSGGELLWSTGDSSYSIEVNQSGTYWIRGRNTFCEAVDSVSLTLLEPVFLDLGKDLKLCPDENEVVYLSVLQNAARYSWSTGEETQVIAVNQPGRYSVEIEAINGCTGADEIVVEEFCDVRIYIPNAFSPNADGLNDVFFIQGELNEFMELFIYDRWGKLIFQTKDQLIGWDGKIGGQDVPEGVYMYRLNYLGTDESGAPGTQSLQGSITLIR